jgi:nitrite reductase/ring-hydroxylating ferredoxin subunit/uncharacterized membrane protein
MLKDFLEGKPLRHPLHPFLVHFPIGLFILSFLLDLASLVFSSAPNLVREAFYAMFLGIITALIAAVPGFVDYTDIRSDHPAKQTATAHLALNLIVVALYGINLGVRSSMLDLLQTPLMPLILSIIGIALLSASGYLGGRLVYDEGVSVGRHKRHTPLPESTLHFSTATLAGNEREKTDAIFVPITEAEHLNEQETVRVEIDGQVIAIARVEGNFYAFQEFCTHRFGPLSEGSFRDFDVQCPWHNSCFDVRTGKVTQGPAKIDLKTFKVEVRDGKICIGLPRKPRNPHDQKTRVR